MYTTNKPRMLKVVPQPLRTGYPVCEHLFVVGFDCSVVCAQSGMTK